MRGLTERNYKHFDRFALWHVFWLDHDIRKFWFAKRFFNFRCKFLFSGMTVFSLFFFQNINFNIHYRTFIQFFFSDIYLLKNFFKICTKRRRRKHVPHNITILGFSSFVWWIKFIDIDFAKVHLIEPMTGRFLLMELKLIRLWIWSVPLCSNFLIDFFHENRSTFLVPKSTCSLRNNHIMDWRTNGIENVAVNINITGNSILWPFLDIVCYVFAVPFAVASSPFLSPGQGTPQFVNFPSHVVSAGGVPFWVWRTCSSVDAIEMTI